VEFAPDAAANLRDGPNEPRFSRGTIKRAVQWAADMAAQGQTRVESARVIALSVDGDPPVLVAELAPGGRRLVLRATEFPTPRWRLVAVIGPDEDVPPALPERLLVFPLPAAARRVPDGAWVTAALIEVAAVMGADITPDRLPDPESSDEDLGMGEARRVRRWAWRRLDAAVEVEVAVHEIYDGATPEWTSVRASVTGLPAGATIALTAALRAEDEPTGRLFLTAPRSTLDRVEPPSCQTGAPRLRAP